MTLKKTEREREREREGGITKMKRDIYEYHVY
jgi:hypothetical protein